MDHEALQNKWSQVRKDIEAEIGLVTRDAFVEVLTCASCDLEAVVVHDGSLEVPCKVCDEINVVVACARNESHLGAFKQDDVPEEAWLCEECEEFVANQ